MTSRNLQSSIASHPFRHATNAEIQTTTGAVSATNAQTYSFVGKGIMSDAQTEPCGNGLVKFVSGGTLEHQTHNRAKWNSRWQPNASKDDMKAPVTFGGHDFGSTPVRPMTAEDMPPPKSASKTPLSDSAEIKDFGGYGTTHVALSDCRAIELRLNECVEALERLRPSHSALCMINKSCQCNSEQKAKHNTINAAIANARKPL